MNKHDSNIVRAGVNATPLERQGQKNRISPILINAAEAAKMLSISKAQLHRKRNAGLFPSPVKLGGNVRWRVAELQAWVEAGMPPLIEWQRMYGGAK